MKINEHNIDISKLTSLSHESDLSQKQNKAQNVSMLSISNIVTTSFLSLANQRTRNCIELHDAIVDALGHGEKLPYPKQQFIKIQHQRHHQKTSRNYIT